MRLDAPTASGLDVGVAGHVATITFDRPERRNALGVEQWAGLVAVLRAIADGPARIVILQGRGTTFSAGADLTAFQELREESAFRAAMAVAGEAALALHALPQVTIAKVRGAAVGGAASLALACDLVLADTSARFSFVFVDRGLSVDIGGSWVLPRLVGVRKAVELCLGRHVLTAEEAADLGMINAVVADAELDAAVAARCDDISRLPPNAVRETKRLLCDGATSSLADAVQAESEAQIANVGTREFAAGLEAFLSRKR